MQKLTIIIITAFFFFSFSPSTNYRVHYGDDYENALKFIQENKKEFTKASKLFGIEEKSLIAVVFPELMRYNLLQNLLETEALELMYVESGVKEVDFSIGNFQMKPSFVELLEEIVAQNEPALENFQSLCSYGNLTDERQIRKKRLERMTSLEWQIKYLSAFYKIADAKIRKDLPKIERLKKIAAYYNCGLKKTEAELEKLMKRPSYPYGYSVKAKMQHLYSDISAYYYLQP
jgi:hypothetical protein